MPRKIAKSLGKEIKKSKTIKSLWWHLGCSRERMVNFHSGASSTENGSRQTLGLHVYLLLTVKKTCIDEGSFHLKFELTVAQTALKI